jgi:pectin methylesterase-like acyl-CoA thioesterase
MNKEKKPYAYVFAPSWQINFTGFLFMNSKRVNIIILDRRET